MNYNFLARTRLILCIFCFFALVIFARLYQIQIVKGNQYSATADKQYTKISNTNFDRGSIFFESKDGIKIAAATIKEGYTLSINPKVLKDPEMTFEAISPYVKLDKKNFMEKATKVNDSYEELQNKLEVSIGVSIADLKIPGVVLTKENWRVYPGKTLSANAIGLVGLDENNVMAGRYGLERYYDELLSRSSQNTTTNIFAEVFAGIKNDVVGDNKKQGDIETSIETGTANFLEKTLQETLNKWSSDSIGGVIMDPKTGQIYAMSSIPNFDPNDLKNITNPKILSNPIVENAYEMGSIIKPLTMATGIDSGAIKQDDTYDDKGFLELNGKKISNYDGKARGVIPMQQILSQSLNVGAAHIALQTGHEIFSKYFKSFGFGQLTGIDQPNEQKGMVKNLDTGRDIETATASYGQGIALTPIQTIRALSILANGGMLVTPHLVNKIEYTDGSTETINDPQTRVLKKETTDEVTNMLVKVVDTALKNGQVKMEHYSIAAKTGTAQIANPTAKGYYDDRYLHSFFGYFPAYNPRFIIFLYQIYPKNVQYASETLTDPFIQIVKFLINYYEIPPDR